MNWRTRHSIGKLPPGVKPVTLTPELRAELEGATPPETYALLARGFDAAADALIGLAHGDVEYFRVYNLKHALETCFTPVPNISAPRLVLLALEAGFVVGRQTSETDPNAAYWIGVTPVEYLDLLGGIATAPTECLVHWYRENIKPKPKRKAKHD